MSEAKFQFRSLADIGRDGFKYRLSAKPDDADVFCAEWYCENHDCVARVVSISVKLHGEKEPKNAHCPLCGRSMKLHGYAEWDEVSK